jgi:hypothetical protein
MTTTVAIMSTTDLANTVDPGGGCSNSSAGEATDSSDFIPSWLPTTDDSAADADPALGDLTTSDLNGGGPVNEEDDIRLPDQPCNTTVAAEVISPTNAALIDLTSSANAAAVQSAASVAPAPPLQPLPQPPPPQMDLIHQAAMLSSVFDDDGGGVVDPEESAAVFPPPSAQAVTEPFDIHMLQGQDGDDDEKQETQHLLISEPVQDGHGGTTANGQLLLASNGAILLSMDSNLLMLNPPTTTTTASQQQEFHEDSPSRSSADLSMPILSEETSGKTVLWSSTAEPGDWPPRSGRITMAIVAESNGVYSRISNRHTEHLILVQRARNDLLANLHLIACHFSGETTVPCTKMRQ